MKRLFFILTVSAIILTSCLRGQSPTTNLSLPLSFVANLKGSDGKFQVIVTENECNIDFLENHSLKDTRLHFNSDKGSATVGDFTREVDFAFFPAQKALITAIRGLCDQTVNKTERDSQVLYTIDKMAIIVYYDEDKTTIIGIETEEGKRRFEFDIAQLQAYEIQSDSAGQS